MLKYANCQLVFPVRFMEPTRRRTRSASREYTGAGNKSSGGVPLPTVTEAEEWIERVENYLKSVVENGKYKEFLQALETVGRTKERLIQVMHEYGDIDPIKEDVSLYYKRTLTALKDCSTMDIITNLAKNLIDATNTGSSTASTDVTRRVRDSVVRVSGPAHNQEVLAALLDSRNEGSALQQVELLANKLKVKGKKKVSKKKEMAREKKKKAIMSKAKIAQAKEELLKKNRETNEQYKMGEGIKDGKHYIRLK